MTRTIANSDQPAKLSSLMFYYFPMGCQRWADSAGIYLAFSFGFYGMVGLTDLDWLSKVNVGMRVSLFVSFSCASSNFHVVLWNMQRATRLKTPSTLYRISN